MNYCDKIHYNIYTTGLATFGEMVDALLAQLPQDEQILRLAFFGMPNDNDLPSLYKETSEGGLAKNMEQKKSNS